VLLAISEEAYPFFFRSMYNKTIIRFGFVISRIVKVLVRVISLSLWLWPGVGQKTPEIFVYASSNKR